MKKIFLFAVATAVALSSCSQNEVMVNPAAPANAIGFGSYFGKYTKAVEMTNTDFETFAVDAYYTNTTEWGSAAAIEPFMRNQTVNKVNDAWEYSPLKYFPNDVNAMVSFFAYSPESDAIKLNKATKVSDKYDVTLSYTCPAAADEQVDLLAAEVIDQKKAADTAAESNDVDFTFSHILSQVAFGITCEDGIDENTAIKVTSVNVAYATSIISNGTYSYNDDEWTLGTTKYAANANSGEMLITDDNDLTSADLAVDTDIHSLMLMPQTTYTAGDIKCTIVYEVTTTDKNNTANNSTIENTAVFNIGATNGTTLAQGTKYTYNVVIDLTSVSVTATVGDWDTDVDDTIDVPAETTDTTDAPAGLND